MSAQATEGRGLAIEWLLRSFAIAVYLMMVAGIVATWLKNTGRYSLLLLLVTEGFTLAMIVVARAASARDASPIPIIATAYTSAYFAFFNYRDTQHLISEAVATALQTVGLIGQIWAKATLGRAFGVLPAARGLVTRGPYRIVRHPIYLAYMIGDVAFLLANASWRNLLVFGLLMLAQVTRILREEATLERSKFGRAYESYREEVRYRVLPPLF